MKTELLDVLRQFALDAEPISCSPYGCGHINVTYLAQTASGRRYILQKINDCTFRDVPALMHNIVLVTEHLQRKVQPPMQALQLVRTSVHALNDNATDLSVQLERIAEGARSDNGPQIELEVLTEHAPANVANCFAAVLREALSNTIRHAHAQAVTVRCMEHPSFYQLIVTDDGANAIPASSRNAVEGMGLGSMRERVEALGGTFTAGPRAGAPGWRVFATIPKQQGDDVR